MKNYNFLGMALCLLILFFNSTSIAASGITYHGKIIQPDGVTPVTSPTTQFRIQIRTPGGENCLLWEEQQTRDLSLTNGVFSLTINDTSEPTLIANTLPYTIERVFSNRTNFTALTGCSSGTIYNPSSSVDGRNLQVFFRENPTDPWEQMPLMKVNYVPLALNSVQLEGYAANEFLKIDPLSSYTPLTAANVNTLAELIAGTNTQYLRPASAFAGDVSGTSSTISVNRIRGTNVVATAPTTGQVLKFDGTNYVPSADDTGSAPADSSYTVKGIVQINTDLATSGLFIAGGVLALPNVITAGGPIGTASSIPVITYDQKGRLTAVSTATVNDTTKLPLAGGTMTGPIDMGTQNITNATSVAATNFSGRNLILSDNDSNTATIRTPTDLTANYVLTLPPNDGGAGEVLTTDGSGVLTWTAVSGGAGDITSVVAGAGLITGGTTGDVTLDVAAGTGIVVNANDVAVDVGTAATKIPQVGGTALGANGVVIANGTGNLASLNCTIGQVIKFDVSGFATCGSDSVGGGGDVSNGGNTFGAAMTIGTNDNFALNLEVNGDTKVAIGADGQVAIGNSATPPNRLVSGFVIDRNPFDVSTGHYANIRNSALFNGVSNNGTLAMIQNEAFLNNSSTWDNVYAAENRVGLYAGNLTNGVGSLNEVRTDNSATSATLISGTMSRVSNGAGTTTTANAYHADVVVTGGTVTNARGLYIDDLQGTNRWGIYQNGASDNNYFAGNVGIGTTTPSTTLDVAGALSVREMAAPALSPADQGRIYFDSTSNKFRVSENGGAYTDLVSAGGASTIDGLTDAITDYTTNYNMYLGTGVGAANTTGSRNTAIGAQTLQAITSGVSNSAFGSEALASLTTGGSNTAIGRESMTNLTTGSNNTALGMYSAASATSGGSNTAIGGAALSSLTTGSSNTAVGSGAIGSASTGIENVGLGLQAGFKANATSSRNIFLGHMAGPAANTAVDDTLWIHNYEGDPTIYGDLFNRRIGLGGMTNPSSTLDINGATTQRGMAAPAVSPAGQGRIYFDSTSNKFRVSQNGGAYTDLVGAGGGITSLGGQSGATQTFAVNATGLTPAINSSSDVHTLSIPLASGAGVTSGTISKTDYDSFVAKLTSPLTTKGDLLTRDGTTHVRLPAGTDGQVLSADSAEASGLRWIAAASGDITSVVAGAGLITGGTTGDVTLDVAAGTGIIVNANDIAIDSGLGASKVPMVGGIALGANGVIVANGTATALTSLNCTLNQVIKFDVTGYATCGTDVGAASSFVNAGNSFGAAATLGTNDNFALNFETNNATQMTILANGNVGIGTTNPAFKLSLDGDGGILATGTAFSGATVGMPGAGVRMLWYPRKASFRVGQAYGSEWDDANIGDNSFAAGGAGIASGYSSTALGEGNTASGDTSTATGLGTVASGAYSTSMGYSTAASGNYSMAVNQGTVAASFSEMVVGAYNLTLGGTPNSWVTTDPLFVVGNGTGLGDRSNAMTVLKNGNVGIGTPSPTAKLEVVGAAVSRPNIITTGNAVDLSLSNVHVLKSVGSTTIALSNMASGGSYTLIVSDTTQNTYTFSGCTNTYFSPTNGQTFQRSTYSILTVIDGGVTDCYISWVTGFN